MSCLKESWINPQYHDTQKTKIKRPHEIAEIMPRPEIKYIDREVLDRIQGSIVGMALGDALGAHVEFRPREFLLKHPVKDLEGGGTWGLKKGEFTDDTSMALCLAASLIYCRDFVPYDQLVRYKWWYRHGYMSATGACFDIGAATSASIREFEVRQSKFAKVHEKSYGDVDFIHDSDQLQNFDVECSRKDVAGNGALMRLTPVPLFFHRHPVYAVKYSGFSGIITHGDRKVYDACRYYGALIVAAVSGVEKPQLLDDKFYEHHLEWFDEIPLVPDILKIARGSYKKNGHEAGIRGKGYIVNALEAALWAFWSTDTFEKGALEAVNLGDDTDTTAAIYGQLAGAFYGYEKLPSHWVSEVYAKEFLLGLGEWIFCEGSEWPPEIGQNLLPTLLTTESESDVASSSDVNMLPKKDDDGELLSNEQNSKHQPSFCIIL